MPSDKDFHFCETYSVKIGVTYDYFLKSDARVKIKSEIYLTQMSMLMDVYACYSYKRYI